MCTATRLNLLILSGLLSCSPILSPTSVGLANGTENVPIQIVSQMSREVQSPKSECSTSQIKEYIRKLSTAALTEYQFEALVKCHTWEAFSLLEEALNSRNSDTRISAAYSLGEIAFRNKSLDAFEILKKHEISEQNTDVLTILNSYDYRPKGGCQGCFPANWLRVL